MAETFLGPVIEKLVDLLDEQVSSLRGVHKEVNNLKDELEIIQPFLKDAEAKLAKREVTNATKVWLKQMRELADRIEDVVDEYRYHLEERRHHERGLVNSLRRAGGCIRSLKPRYDIASEIRDINESLEKIKGRGISYGLRPFEQGSSSSAVANGDASVVDPRFGSLFIEEDELVGIESTSEELIRSLVEGSSTRSVISLVGEGGIGKTTLARKVNNAEAVKKHFDCCAWITVSQSYNIEKVLKIMKNQICPAKKEPVGTIEALTDLLRQYLETKRYVVVFDDVWQFKFWEVIKHALPSNNQGSRIIITTRKTSVANMVANASCDVVRNLKAWSLESAWELFCKKAFPLESKGCCPQELKQLSDEIIRKCQGLPLAIAAVAGLLSKKEKTKVEWQRVLDNLNCEFDSNVSEVLAFSYHDLPYHLKSCLLYFSIFPEDYSICEIRLYKLWISEDFIVKSKTNMTLEEVATVYLSELIDRNLISFEIRYGVERWCRVHDLIRDMILIRVDELSFCQIVNESKLRFKGKSRRLSIHGTTKDVLNLVGDYSKIRSIFVFNIDELTESFVITLIEKFKLLRVLDFEEAPLDKLPKEIGNLFNLKYLNLNDTAVEIVPKSIGKLRYLQTLNLAGSLVQELPIEIKKLRNLRHLLAFPKVSKEIDYTLDLDLGVKIHEGIGSLEELQTLSSMRAYPSRVNIMEELERLTKLKALHINQLTTKIGKSLGSSIEKMTHLERLYLGAINKEEVIDLRCISSCPPLLRSLRLFCQLQQLPNWISKLQNLQRLDLYFSRLTSEPLKHLKDFPKLVYLNMSQAYNGEELHFEASCFKKLKHLLLRELEELKVVKIDSGALPLLEKLEFGPSPLMKKMPSNIQHLTNLKSLKIFDMPREFVLSLQPEHEDYWKIQHIPFVNFWYKYKGILYEDYNLGASNLLELLEEQAS